MVLNIRNEAKIMSSKKMELPSNLEQQIVTGIMSGYKSYLDERIRAKQNLKVSAAYAWTKGNHIDSEVAVAVENNQTIDFSTAKAGYVWEYLQFTATSPKSDETGKALIFIKGSRSAKKNFDGKKVSQPDKNYLREYAKINQHLFKSGQVSGTSTNHSVQLELPINEIRSSASDSFKTSDFDRFYIVTYEIDKAYQISSIKLTMPDPSSMSLVIVKDLTDLIQNSIVTIETEEFDAVRGDKVPDAQYTDQPFGYEIAAEEEQNPES